MAVLPLREPMTKLASPWAKGMEMASDKIPADIRKLNFEDSLEQLEEVVRELESGTGDLDSAIESYARGVQLRRHCEARLKDAQAKIDKIVLKTDGTVASVPLGDA